MSIRCDFGRGISKWRYCKTVKVYLCERIEMSSCYKYLGILIFSRLSWSPAQKTLSQQAVKSLYSIDKIDNECNFSLYSSNDIFDKCVLPVALYGSEIWGTDVHSSVEDVLLKYCRHQMGVGRRSSAVAVLGECGQNKLYV